MRPGDVTSPVLDPPGGGEPISWMEYDRRRLNDFRRRFERDRAWRARQRRALTWMKQARNQLLEDGDFGDAIKAIDEAVMLVPVSGSCGRTPEMLWLGSAHLVYTTEELGDLFSIDVQAVNKRISDMHGHYRDALGLDHPCRCGHPFGHPLIECHR